MPRSGHEPEIGPARSSRAPGPAGSGGRRSSPAGPTATRSGAPNPAPRAQGPGGPGEQVLWRRAPGGDPHQRPVSPSARCRRSAVRGGLAPAGRPGCSSRSSWSPGARGAGRSPPAGCPPSAFLGLGKGGVGAAGWSGAAGTRRAGPRTTRSSFWGIKPQKDERVASALGSSRFDRHPVRADAGRVWLLPPYPAPERPAQASGRRNSRGRVVGGGWPRAPWRTPSRAEATPPRCVASRTRCRARCGGCGPSTSRASVGPR